MIETVDCGTLRNHENRKNTPMTMTMTATGPMMALPPLAPGHAPADVDRAEPGIDPVHDEDAEPLLDACLDVVLGGRIAARQVELLACREHLLDGLLPALGVERPLALGVGRREHAAQRAGAGEQHADPFHRRDLAHVR